MTKNFFKVDTKKDDIIFNQDYIIINGCLMFHKTVACIGLDVELLQDKINNNIPFNYKDKNFISELPLCEKLLPEDLSEYDLPNPPQLEILDIDVKPIK